MADDAAPNRDRDSEEFDRGCDEMLAYLIAALESDGPARGTANAGPYMMGAFCGLVQAIAKASSRTAGVTPADVAAGLGAVLGDVIAEAEGQPAPSGDGLTLALQATVSAWAPRAEDGTPFFGGRDLLRGLAGLAAATIASAPRASHGRLIDFLVEEVETATRSRALNPAEGPLRGINLTSRRPKP